MPTVSSYLHQHCTLCYTEKYCSFHYSVRHHLRCVLVSPFIILPLSIFHYAPLLLIICLYTYLLLFVLCYGCPCSLLVYKYLVLHCIPYLIINYKSVFPFT
jgi:hypothetical protein